MIRVPRMHAFPWQTAGSTVMRSFQFSIDSMLPPFGVRPSDLPADQLTTDQIRSALNGRERRQGSAQTDRYVNRRPLRAAGADDQNITAENRLHKIIDETAPQRIKPRSGSAVIRTSHFRYGFACQNVTNASSEPFPQLCTGKLPPI